MDGGLRRQNSWKESVMKCANPDCNRKLVLSFIGAAGSASGDTVQSIAAMRSCHKKLQQKQGVSTYFEWLFLQPIKNPRLKLKPAVIRTRAD
jgi:hypothetical protein